MIKVICPQCEGRGETTWLVDKVVPIPGTCSRCNGSGFVVEDDNK